VLADDDFYAAAERRIEILTVAIGATGAIACAFLWNWRAAAGVASGAVLSWINYRWLKQGVATLARLSTAQSQTIPETEKVRVPASVYLKFLGRYALLIAAAYAILRSFNLPAASLLAGLFAVIAAVILEMLGQLFRSGPAPRADA
jgi:hypothetical protein